MPPSLTLSRTHLGRHDLDWLPRSFKAVRWTVAGAIWTGLGAATAATLVLAKIQPFFYGKGIAMLAAGGYYAGDRAARAVLRRRLASLARGATDLRGLGREADGELIHVRGRVRAKSQGQGQGPATLEGLVSGAPSVYRRLVFVLGGVRLVHEAAVDFAIVDGTGELVTVLAADARLLAVDPKRHALAPEVIDRLAELSLPDRSRAELAKWMDRRSRGKRTVTIEGAETLLCEGAAIELVGYKARMVDPSVAERLERDMPMRAILKSGSDLPLLISPID